MTVPIIVVLALMLAWESWRPFFGFFGKDRKAKAVHDGWNLAIGAFNGFLIALVFASLWAAAASWSYETGFGLLRWIELPWVLRLAAVFLLFDVYMYWWHRINHEIPFLWRFHIFHHTDEQMDVTTATRFHTGEIVLSSLLRIPVIVVLGVPISDLVIYEAVMFAVVQFHHADIRIPDAWEQRLSKVIVTPNLHKVHHSAWLPETDSNYGSLFSFWDQVFGSKRVRHDVENIRFGVDPAEPTPPPSA